MNKRLILFGIFLVLMSIFDAYFGDASFSPSFCAAGFILVALGVFDKPKLPCENCRKPRHPLQDIEDDFYDLKAFENIKAMNRDYTLENLTFSLGKREAKGENE